MLLNHKDNGTTIVANESYTVEADGLLLAVSEGFADMQEIHEFISESCMEATTKVLTEGASLEVLQEGFAGDLYEKVKAALKKLWGKVKGFFSNVIRFFEGIFLSGKKFAEKYEDLIKEKDLSKFKFTMFEYTLDKVDITKVFTKVRSATLDALTKAYTESEIKGRKTEAKRKVWGLYVSGATSEEQFGRGLHKVLRGGKDSAREITPKVGELVALLKDNSLLDDVKEAAKDADESFQKQLDTYDERRETASKNDGRQDAARALRARHAAFIEAKGIAAKVFSAWESAAKEYLSAAKSCVVKAASYKEPKDD